MADYTGLIRVGVEGLGEINRLNTALQRASNLLGNLENAQVITGQIGEGAARNVQTAAQRRAQAGRRLRDANLTVQNVAQRRDPETGRFVAGGPNTTARRLAGRQLQLARREVRESERFLREQTDNQQVVFRANRRYARAIDRTTNVLTGTQRRTQEQQIRNQRTMERIGEGSRGNYLTNLFQGRGREFARGGAGLNLSPQLQAQARNVRAAWDIATAGGQENLRLMQRLATEMSGLVRQQNELNRGRSGRSVAFEAGRRGQERITDLSRMPGADSARIRRLRSQATNVIATSNLGDIAGSRDANRRLNASIVRYQRQLDAAARELRIAQRRGGPVSSIRGNAYTPGSPAYIDRMARIGGPRESARGRKDLPGSPAYIEEQRKQQSQQLQRAISAGGPRESARGRKDLVGSPAYYEEQQRQLRKAISAGGPRESIKGRKDVPGSPAYIEEQRKQQAQQLQRAVRAGGPRESVKGRKEVAGSPAYYEEQQRQLQRAIRAGGPSEKIAGRKDLTGSPAYLEEQRKQQSQQLQRAIRAGGPSEKISGRKDLPGSPAFYEEQRRQLDRAIRAGGPREKIAGRKDLPGSPAYIEAQRREANRAAALQRRQNERELQAQQKERDRIARLRQIASPIRGTATMVGSPAYLDAQARAQRTGGASGRLGPASPIGGTKTMVGSPAYLAEQRRQQGQKGFFQGNARKAVGEGLIGGAFPLLFGQGAGASVGGFAGGAIGGLIGGSFGFGLSLIGTAVGQVVDTTVNKLGGLVDALSSASDSIKALEAAGFRVRDSQKIQVAQLEKVGRGYDAQAVVLKEIESRLGPGSVAQAEKLNEAQKQLSDSWAALSLQIGVALVPGIAEAIRIINSLLPGLPNGAGSGATPKTTRPRTASLVLADIDASIALNQALKAGNREYANLVRDVEDFKRDNEEKIFEMRRKGVDIEKQKSDLRLEVENKIFDMRQETAKLESDNARTRAQLAIGSFGLDLARQADAAGGKKGDFISQVKDYLQARDQGEADLQAKERDAKLKIATDERALQQYILQVSEKVAQINRAVEDYKRDQEKFRFESSRRIEDYRIKAEDYIFSRVKDRYEYAIGSEQEILRIKMQAATDMGATLPPDAGQVLSGRGPTAIGMAGLANPLGPQRTGRAPWWNQGLGAGRGHQGQDIGVDVGTTIHAMEDAVVSGVIKGFGKVGDAVVLRYANSDRVGVYGHINPMVAEGQSVKAGQQIGMVSPWMSKGKDNTHLHYELWRRKNGLDRGQLLDPTERLRAAMSGRSMAPAMPATPSQRRSGPAMLVPPVSGPAVQPSVPTTTDSMFDRRQSSAKPGIGDQFISMLGKQGGFEDVAGPGAARKPWAGKPGQFANKGSFQNGLDAINKSGASPFGFYRGNQNDLKLLKKFYSQNPSAANQYDLPVNLYLRYLSGAGAKGLEINGDQGRRIFDAAQRAQVKYQNPDEVSEFINRAIPAYRPTYRKRFEEGQVPVDYPEIGSDPQTLFSLGRYWAKKNKDNSFSVKDTFDFDPATLKRGGGGSTPEFDAAMNMAKFGKPFNFEFRISPDGKTETVSPLGPRSSAETVRPAFDTSKIESNLGNVASTDLTGLLAQALPALPRSAQVLPGGAPAGTSPGTVGLQVQPFAGPLPTYRPAPMAAPLLPPAPPQLPPAPAPMVMPSTGALKGELGKQKDALMQSVSLAEKLQKVENGILLLQLASTREVRDRLESAAKELSLETDIAGISKSLSDDERSRAIEKANTLSATKDLNDLEEQSLGFAKELLQSGRLQKQEYDDITNGIRERIGYEKDLLQITEERAELARKEAFGQRSGELVRDTRLTGAGLRAGRIGAEARAFEEEMKRSGNIKQANEMADLTRKFEDQRLVWGNLEKDITSVSDAISGALTNGLVDIVSGAREIQDVGRDMLNTIAGSFADTAQQQLGNLIQRQLGGLLGGAQGPLVKMLGAGGEVAGPQALGNASVFAAGEVTAFGVALQVVAAQMAMFNVQSGLGSTLSGGLSSAFSGGGSALLGGLGSMFSGSGPALSSGLGSALSSVPTNLFSKALTSIIPFGGFLAEGGTTKPGEGYIVGEKEPEFFFPGVSGRVVPRSDMEKAAALRQGDTQSDPLELDYTVTVQQGERYVSEEQMRRNNASILKQAQARTYAGMRNNNDVRSFVGI